MNWSDLTDANREAVKLIRLYAHSVREQNPRIREGLTDRLERKIEAHGIDSEMTGALTGVCFSLMRRLSSKNDTTVDETVTDLIGMIQSVHTDESESRESGVLRGLELLNALESGANPTDLSHLLPRSDAATDHHEDIRLALDVANGLMNRVGADPMRLA